MEVAQVVVMTVVAVICITFEVWYIAWAIREIPRINQQTRETEERTKRINEQIEHMKARRMKTWKEQE